MNLTEEQKAVIQWAKDNNSGHLILDSVAGSGKTTTLQHVIKEAWGDKNVVVLSHGKKIAQEFNQKLKAIGAKEVAATMHSLGFAILRDYGQVNNIRYNVDGRKFYKIFDLIVDPDVSERSQLALQMGRVIDIFRNRYPYSEPTVELIQEIGSEYGFDRLIQDPVGSNTAIRAFNHMNEWADEQGIIDFTDMIYQPLRKQIKRLPFKYQYLDGVIVDEIQDWTMAQLELAMKLLSPTTQIIGAGDQQQSIFYWAGAHQTGMEYTKGRLREHGSVTELDLTYTFRSPKSHIQLASIYNPKIKSAGAEEGVIRIIQDFQLPRELREQTRDVAVISRYNAPLIGLQVGLFKHDKYMELPKMEGLIRDMKFYVEILKSWTDEQVNDVTPDTFDKMRAWVIKSSMKIDPTGQLSRERQDTVDCLECIIRTRKMWISFDHVVAFIDTLFNKTSNIKGSSVHRFKGREAEIVYICDAQYLPAVWTGITDEKAREEENIAYVALTRSLKELVIVEGAYGPFDIDEGRIPEYSIVKRTKDLLGTQKPSLTRTIASGPVKELSPSSLRIQEIEDAHAEEETIRTIGDELRKLKQIDLFSDSEN